MGSMLHISAPLLHTFWADSVYCRTRNVTLRAYQPILICYFMVYQMGVT